MPGNIVGAIANEADIEGRHIGRISIHDEYSTIDLPAGMPAETFEALKKVWVAGQRLGISKMGEKSSHKGRPKLSAPKRTSHKKSRKKPIKGARRKRSNP